MAHGARLQPRAGGAAMFAWWSAVAARWLVRPARADTYDVGIVLFQQPGCMVDRSDEMVLMDGGCYANIWSDANVSRAVKFQIVRFEDPQRIDVTEYIDDCHTPNREARTLIGGKNNCNRIIGAMYGEISTRFRSTTCQGKECSKLAVAVQSFYAEEKCRGTSYALFRYPVSDVQNGRGACLRYHDGTQAVAVDESDSNITLIDYPSSDYCVSEYLRSYTIRASVCYALYQDREPRSFRWRIDRALPYTAASKAASSRRFDLTAAGLCALILVGVLGEVCARPTSS